MRRLEPLNRTEHDRERFDCSEARLNDFLQRHAAQQADRGVSQTYVLVESSESPLRQVVGYFTLRPNEICRDSLPVAIRTRYPNKIGAYLLAKLAVHVDHRGKGIGTKLLREVYTRVIGLIEQGGGVGLFVDAMSEDLVSFYVDRGFTRLAGNSLELYIPKSALATIVGSTPAQINFDDTPNLPM